MLKKTRGVVLRTLKYKDTSIIVDIYTEVTGRASFLVSVPRSRKAAVKTVIFQPLSLIELEADFRPHATIYKVREAKLYYPFSSLPYDPYKSAIALFLAEFLYKAVREEVENPLLFTFLQHSIIWLDTCNRSISNFHLVFLMRLSRFLGFYPNLKDYSEGCYFDWRNACFTPQPPTLHTQYLNVKESSLVVKLMRLRYETMHLFLMSHTERNRCLSVLIDYYRLHLTDFSELKSWGVLQELFND